MTIRERTIEMTLIRELRKAGGGICLKCSVANRIGFPDRIILFPGGRLGFVELKKPKGGVTSEHQSRWIRLLAKYGFVAAVVSNTEEVHRFVEELKSNE